MAPKPKPWEERFWPKVKKTKKCWIWTGALRRPGSHGLFAVSGSKSIGAHVAAWIITYGPIPEGMKVCHHCDNPPCVRPSHLFLGTQKDNLQDMSRKGRGSGQKLLPYDKEVIVYLSRRKEISDRDLAEIFKVSRRLIRITLGTDKR